MVDVKVNRTFPFIHSRAVMEVSRGSGYKKESDEGKVSTQHTWTDRIPHPTNMGKYDKWANDAEANMAFNVLTDIIAGVGYHTEMPEDVDENHKHKKLIDDYGENVNLDERLHEITMAQLQKGFCPVERLTDYDLKLLPPETFYIWRTKKGRVYRYTQEHSIGDIVAMWEHPSWQSILTECKEVYKREELEESKKIQEFRKGIEAGDIDDIVLFKHRATTSWPYGKSLVEPIGSLLDEREQMNKDMPKAIHRWAYPIPFLKTNGPKAPLEKACTDRDVDQWVFIGNVEQDDVTIDTLAIDPQARFIPYIELMYYQICEGLHAPLLLYLKNATEASATVMMESVDRLVNGVQRYNKRRVEKYFFEPQVGDPVPRMVWGAPKTGLEEVTLTDIAQIMPYLANNQKMDLLKQYGIYLPEPEKQQTPQPMPFQPFQKPIEVPMEQLLEKMNDLNASLEIIESNYVERRITVVNAMRLGDRTITVYFKRMYPSSWKSKRDEEFEKFSRRILQLPKPSMAYKVQVE